MSEDITFCVNMKCKMRCERNPRNIRVHWIPHSFACFEECEYWDAPEKVDESAGRADENGL